jgi:Holliday junction DNA helicase RuvA
MQITIQCLPLKPFTLNLYDEGMIRQIRGKVLMVGVTSAVVEVAGFGIEVRMNAPEVLSVGSEAILATHLEVKQDGVDLYGFLDPADRDFFELMLSVSGVGPKTALSVLRRAPRESLEGAIGKRDLAYLTKVVGLGKKSAEKILVELCEKVGPRSHDNADGEVFDTLVALGYTEREARRALQTIPVDAVGKDVRLKAALSSGN